MKHKNKATWRKYQTSLQNHKDNEKKMEQLSQLVFHVAKHLSC